METAIKENNFELVKELIESGEFDPNTRIQGKTLLMLAAKYADSKMLQYLVKRCNVNDKAVYDPSDPTDTNGWTALHFACQIGNYENVLYLLEHGADTKITTDQGVYPFSIWLFNCNNNTVSDVKYILKRLYPGSEVIYKDIINDVIWCHSGRRLIEIIRILASFGADINDSSYKTPLHLVCESNMSDEFIKETLETLIELGSDPFLKGANISALEYTMGAKTRNWMAEVMLEKYNSK